MADDLDAIVTASIDGLVKIKQEEAELERLIEKATTRKDKVPDAVFQRVVGDYTTRIAALETDARPLRQQARTEFVKLGTVHQQARETLDKAEFDRQEIEFRHDVGEFDDEEFDRRIGAARATVEAGQQAFDRAEALRQRFLEVLPTDAIPAEPGGVESPASEPVVAEPAAPLPAASAPAASATAESVAAAVEPPHGGPPPLPPSEAAPAAPAPDGTVVGLPPSDLPPIAAPDDSRAHAAPDGESFATVAIAPAVLVEEGGKTYKLGALTSIGRVANNTIVVPVREVSRNHAQVVLTENGYLLKDLESGNGTFVNGNRVREWRLQENDRVQVGDRILVFKSR